MLLFLKIVAKTLSQHPVACLLFLLSLPFALSSQTHIATATIDTSKTGAPISKNIYASSGHAIEPGIPACISDHRRRCRSRRSDWIKELAIDKQLRPHPGINDVAAVLQKLADAKSPADLAAESPGFASAQYATAAAWAPNPKNPPLYFDLPTKDGLLQQEIVSKYTANSPLAFVDQYIGNLKQYRAISMDVGDQDGLRFDAVKLHTILDHYEIANSLEIYSGTHVSAVADRFQNQVLPFFSKNLCFTADCR